MSILSRLSRFARANRARRLRIRTFMQVSELPNYLQKDLGFPDADGFGEDIRNHRSYATERP